MTRSDWEALRERVFSLDRDMVLRHMFLRDSTLRQIPCPAWVMDPNCEPCAPMLTWQLDHVKDDPRLAEKAPDDEEHLVSLCANHDERGMKAGYQWNTAHRPEERAYLAERSEDVVTASV